MLCGVASAEDAMRTIVRFIRCATMATTLSDVDDDEERTNGAQWHRFLRVDIMSCTVVYVVIHLHICIHLRTKCKHQHIKHPTHSAR